MKQMINIATLIHSKHMSVSTKELISLPEQKKAKELELARELYDKHTHLIERTLYALLGQPHSVAHSKSMEYEDLLQYARMGLWEACISYDSSKSQFETYTINHIRWSVQMGLE